MFDGHNDLRKTGMRSTVHNFRFYKRTDILHRRWASRRPPHSKWNKSKKGEKASMLSFFLFACLLSAAPWTNPTSFTP